MFYAGGPNASREQLVSARTRVTAAVVHALKTGQLQWEDVKDLETLAKKTDSDVDDKLVKMLKESLGHKK